MIRRQKPESGNHPTGCQIKLLFRQQQQTFKVWQPQRAARSNRPNLQVLELTSLTTTAVSTCAIVASAICNGRCLNASKQACLKAGHRARMGQHKVQTAFGKREMDKTTFTSKSTSASQETHQQKSGRSMLQRHILSKRAEPMGCGLVALIATTTYGRTD